MKIDYSSSGFLNSSLNGNSQFDVSWHDLIWATVTVGKPSWGSMFNYGLPFFCDVLSRLSILRTTIRTPSLINNYFLKTDYYQTMERSEKGFVSYVHGMMMAKLVANKLLDIPWLVHLEHFEEIDQVIFGSGKSRPDLIGKKRVGMGMEYSVFEAKGRSGGFDKRALDKAKDQTRMISTINGQIPVYRVATESYWKNGLKVAIVDPDDFKKEAVPVRFSEKQFFTAYYGRVLHLDRLKDTPLLNQFGIKVVLSGELEKALATQNFDAIYKLEIPSDHEDRGEWKKFSDGIAIGLNPKIWNDSMENL